MPPMVILEPNPPEAPFQRKPTTAAPNAPSDALIKVTVARLKNWRRETPIASGSGGDHGATSACGRGASATVREATAAASTSRPVTTDGSSLPRSLRRVSRASVPVPRTPVRRADVRTTPMPATMITAIAMVMMEVLLMSS
ncbi:MAG: hypothetical protein EBQ75_01435, partial [Actinobacteria bacterium]|nr:hypothetical protein [Actinomycetota bacterium]